MKEIESWQNGEWIPNSKTSIPIWDAHCFFGWCVFEALRTYNKNVFLIDEHINRLFKSAKLTFIPLVNTYTQEQVKELVLQVIRHNQEFFDDKEEIRVMIFVSPGNFKIYEDMGTPKIRLTINITTTSRYAPHIAPYIKSGFKGIIVTQPQIPSRFLDAKIKSCSRLHYGIADKEASQYGSGTKPILLDEHGYITESSGGNIAFFKNDKICLPQENDMLRGCTMEYVKEICKLINIDVEHNNWSPYDIINSDGAFFTSTFFGIIPCSNIVYRGKTYKIMNEKGTKKMDELIHKFDYLVRVNTWKQWSDWVEE